MARTPRLTERDVLLAMLRRVHPVFLVDMTKGPGSTITFDNEADLTVTFAFDAHEQCTGITIEKDVC